MKISCYEAICNLGNNTEEIYLNAILGNDKCFEDTDEFIKERKIHVGKIKSELPEIESDNFNIRCNRLLLKNLELIKDKILSLPKDRTGVIVATTNSGVEEFEKSNKKIHTELGNPALFLKQYLGLNNYCTTVSTACSSGLKAFSLARDLLENEVSDYVIVACVDTLAKVPLFGFSSLEVLSDSPTIPFSKNRCGINIGEASAIFVLEKDNGIEVLGFGENSDVYHSTTPDPEAKEAINAIREALSDAKLSPDDIDYINAHGTGTGANDLMEANAIFEIFEDKAPTSSTKTLTGHCLGAAAGIETALCCKLIENFDGRLYPNVYDNVYDDSMPKINLVEKDKIYKRCKICMCNSFGFGGTNAIMILGRKNEQ